MQVGIGYMLQSQVVDRLARSLAPKAIYLFGSRAWGNPSPVSDFDLVLLLNDDTPINQSSYYKAYASLTDLEFAKDILLMHEATFKKRSLIKGSLPYKVIHEGVLIYEHLPAVIPNTDMYMEEKLILVSQWLHKAQTDLKTAKLLQNEVFETAVYHAQQAAEKALKGLLLFYDHPLQKTHDIGRLIEYASKYEDGLRTWLEKGNLLTPYGTVYRYSGEYESPSQSEVDEACRLASDLLQLVTNILEEKM